MNNNWFISILPIFKYKDIAYCTYSISIENFMKYIKNYPNYTIIIYVVQNNFTTIRCAILDENKRNLKLDNQDLKFTFDLSEKEEKSNSL